MARILVIEDNPLIREVLQLELNEAGHEVHAVADGRSGLALVEDVRPDAVVLDLQMPGMYGSEVLEKLRLVCPNVPVFLFTVYGDVEHRVEGLDVQGCFVKSGDLTPLLRAIDRAVGS